MLLVCGVCDAAVRDWAPSAKVPRVHNHLEPEQKSPQRGLSITPFCTQ